LGVQPNLIVRGEQHLRVGQGKAQMGQQATEVATGGGFRGVRPEEEAELLAGDGL
jgi:hypothetical protein